MSKITDNVLNAMTLADLSDLSKRIKIAEKTHRQNANKAVASVLIPGDQVEFTLPKTTNVQVGVVTKVKRVMIALKAIDNSAQWNVPLTSIGKKIADAPKGKIKAVKSTKTSAKASKPVVKASKKASKKATKTKAVRPSTGKSSSSDVIKAIREKIAAKKTETVSKSATVAPSQEEATTE